MFKHVSQIIAVVVLVLTTFKTASAQLNIPIIGADEVLSQYTCVTLPGVKTYGMKVVKANGSVADISVRKAKDQVANQIENTTKKILSVSDLLSEADSEAKRDKLQLKLIELRSKRESLKYIKKQIAKCGKAELEFSVRNTPELLTKVITHPSFAEPLIVFMYGFRFTVPKHFEEGKYCVIVNGAHDAAPSLGGVVYYDNFTRYIESYPGCQDFGFIGYHCLPGLEADEAMIIITQGAIVERNGICSTPYSCSFNELKNFLPQHYSEAVLASFVPGACPS